MSELHLDDNTSTYQIRGFKPGQIQINQDIYTRSVMLSATQLLTDWAPQKLSELTAEHLNVILSFNPTLVLIGTGETLTFPPIEVYGELINQGIGVEIMNTSAACHTFNVLTAEERKVVAALLL